MSSSTSNSPLSNIITPPTPLFDEIQRKNDLLHKLKLADKNHDILEKQLRQTQRDYGDLLLVNSETASELSESRREAAVLRAELNRLNSDNNGERHELTRQVAELRIEVKQLKHNNKEANAEVEEMRKKAKALETENWVLRGIREEAKAAEEKAKKERDEAVTQNMKLKRDNDAIIDSATNKFKAFEKRVVVLESCVATIKNNIQAGEEAVAPASQEKMEPVVVDLDSD
ncbi:uncharacterized protein LOC141653756 [Silene latifolia]|uniref:uncharacterized protein LOC141653756 n=1 Tax=Silene latifolia TaxID=37657 RepID=UPI003D789947